MIIKIKKRDGREVPFNIEKISNAIFKAAQAVGGQDYETSIELAEKVTFLMNEKYDGEVPSVENIQDMVEKVLIESGHAKTAKEYILYRAERTKVREMNTNLMRSFMDLTFKDTNDMGEANWDNRSMSMIFRYASESVRKFYDLFVLNPEYSRAHRDGIIYIHNLEFLTLTMESCHIDMMRLFNKGFNIGEVEIQRPRDIFEYANLINVVLHNNQNEQAGEQSIPNFDYVMAEGVRQTYVREYQKSIKETLGKFIKNFNYEDNIDNIFEVLKSEYNLYPKMNESVYMIKEEEYLKELFEGALDITNLQEKSREKAIESVEAKLEKALKNLFYNLNIIKSRLGGKEIMSSISFGTDRTMEGRMVTKTILNLNRDENISRMKYPNQIFKLKEGINFKMDDENYDLYITALKQASEMSRPRFVFLDAAYNLNYYNRNKPQTEVTYGIKGERIISNIHDLEKEIIFRRGMISSTTLNLPRIALMSDGDLELFYEKLNDSINLSIAQLLERFEVLAGKKVKDFPFLMGEHLWMDAEQLGWNDEIRGALKNGNLSIGFMGLSECLTVLTGENHSKSKESQSLGIEIVRHMEKRVEDIREQYWMNFTLRATYSKNIGKRLLEKDREDYGIIEDVTDSEYYTNGFNINNEALDLTKKIEIEGPYHRLVKGGHIFHIDRDLEEIDLEKLKMIMKNIRENNIGYVEII